MTLTNPLPPLEPDEYAALEKSILEHGFWSSNPIVLDEDGAVLDGFNRKEICDKHGIEYATVVLAGLSPWEKLEYAVKSNVVRRQLSPAQRREVLKRLIATHDAELRAEAKAAQAEGGRKGAASRKGVSPETKREAAANATETPFNDPAVAPKAKPTKPKVDRSETYGNLLGVSRATAARDKQILDRLDKIEVEAQRQNRDDVLRQLNGSRPNLDELERAVGLRAPLPPVQEPDEDRLGWIDALATAFNHLSGPISAAEADRFVEKSTDPALVIVQIGALRGAVAEAKQRKAGK